MTAADVRAAFNATALDVSPIGFDNRAGAGLLRADRLLVYTGATAQPLVRPGDRRPWRSRRRRR